MSKLTNQQFACDLNDSILLMKSVVSFIYVHWFCTRQDQLVLQNIFNCGINIDKIIPPGRPIICHGRISQIWSVTEYIGHYIDHFLVPIVQNQCTYIKDTTDFINKIESLRSHANCWLVSFDITWHQYVYKHANYVQLVQGNDLYNDLCTL
jgi:hypothetical protein